MKIGTFLYQSFQTILLAIVCGVVAYDHLIGVNHATGVGPDPSVIKLGKAYKKALIEGARQTLKETAESDSASSAAAITTCAARFKVNTAAAWKPIAAEMTRRFGPPSDKPLDRPDAFKQFLEDIETGLE